MPGVLRTIRPALGVGMAVKETIRAGLDRALPGGTRVPLRAGDITPGWLAAELGLHAGAITSLEVLDEHSGTAARARIGIEGGGTRIPNRLFVKLTPRNFTQHVMMNLFDLGTTEVLAYAALGSETPVRIPRCYATGVDRIRGRVVLLLEDLSDTARFRTVRDSLSASEAESVIDAMAKLHVSFWNSPRFSTDLKSLTGRSFVANALGDLIRRRLMGNMRGQAADLVPASVKRQSHLFFERSADIDSMWASLPRTLLHGDPHLGNLFFEANQPGFLDWQVATAGAGIRDVAYFATASVEPDLLRKIERGLVTRYAAHLDSAGIRLDFEPLWTLYRVGITEFYMSAVCASEAGERAQPLNVSRVGVERAVAGVQAHDSFALLAELIEDNPSLAFEPSTRAKAHDVG